MALHYDPATVRVSIDGRDLGPGAYPYVNKRGTCRPSVGYGNVCRAVQGLRAFYDAVDRFASPSSPPQWGGGVRMTGVYAPDPNWVVVWPWPPPG